jgi:hypothetical protein
MCRIWLEPSWAMAITIWMAFILIWECNVNARKIKSDDERHLMEWIEHHLQYGTLNTSIDHLQPGARFATQS